MLSRLFKGRIQAYFRSFLRMAIFGRSLGIPIKAFFFVRKRKKKRWLKIENTSVPLSRSPKTLSLVSAIY